MNNAETQSITNIPSRAIFGPVCLLFSLSLLYFKESPLFVAFTAAALLGLMLSWKWEKNGLYLSLSALSIVVVYQLVWSDDSLTLWEFGLSASLAIAFVTTTLAKTEITDLVEEQAQEKIETIQSEYFSLKEVLQKYERIIKEKNSKIEALELTKDTSQDLKKYEEALKEKDALIAELKQKEDGNHEILAAQEMLKRYENAIQEKNIIIDDLHERLDKIDTLNGGEPTSSKDVLKRYEESLQEKIAIITNLQEKVRIGETLRNDYAKASKNLEALLQEKNAAITQLLESKKTDFASLQEKLSQSEKALQEKNAAIEILESRQIDSATLQNKLLHFEKALEDKETAVAIAQNELIATQSKLLEYEKILQEKNAFIESKQIDSATLQDKLLHYEKALEDNETAVQQLAAAHQELSTAQSKLLEYEKVLAEKNADAAALQEQALHYNQIIEAKDATLNQLQSKAELLAATQADSALTREKLIESEKALEEVHSALAQKNELLSKLESDLDAIQSVQRRLEEELNEKSLLITGLQEKSLEKIKNLEGELDNLLSSLHDERNHNSSLEKRIEKMQEELASAKKQEETISLKDRKIQQLEESYQRLRDQVKEHEGFNFSKLLEKDRIIEKNLTKVKELEGQLENIKGEIVKKTELLDSTESKIKELTSQIEELLEKLKKIESDKGELEEVIGSVDKSSLSKNLARAEGMYRQLREQFEEKTKVLNDTRKELFLITEEKNTIELNYLEETTFGRAETLEKMEKYVLDLTKVVESQEEEIELLQELITHNIK